MSVSGRYDGSLQMFVEDAHEPDFTRLVFLRWLGEQHRLEHDVCGPSSGELAGSQATDEVAELALAN